jgi:hypothetical protein
LLHAFRPGDNRKRYDFSVDILNQTDKDEQFLHRVMFSDEATFRVSGHVHQNNVRIWANELPHEFVEHERDSPKVNLWCALSRDRVIGPYFFTERTATPHNYLDILELFAVPQVDDDKMVLLRTMPTLLRNFLMRHVHGAVLGSNGPHDLRT